MARKSKAPVESTGKKSYEELRKENPNLPNYDLEHMTSMQRAYLAVKGKSYKNHINLKRNQEQMKRGVTDKGEAITGNLLKAFEINTKKMEAKKKALDTSRWNLSRIVYNEQARARKQGYENYQFIDDKAMQSIRNYNSKKFNANKE